MAFVDDLSDLFSDTCQHAAFSSRDDFGAPSFGSDTEYNCRLVRKHRIVRDLEGQEVVSTAHLWIQGSPAITPQDRITLSDATTPVIIAVEQWQDELGSAFTKVFF